MVSYEFSSLYTTLPHKLIKDKIYTPYVSAAGMLLHINGKFTMGKMK